MTLSVKSLHHKRERKEAKRKIKRAAIRKSRNLWNGLGKTRQVLAQERCRRKLGIKMALENLANLIKKWNDKISLELVNKIEEQKTVLLAALKTKQIPLIDKAVNDFVPLDKEVRDIVAKYDTPVQTIPEEVKSADHTED